LALFVLAAMKSASPDAVGIVVGVERQFRHAILALAESISHSLPAVPVRNLKYQSNGL